METQGAGCCLGLTAYKGNARCGARGELADGTNCCSYFFLWPSAAKMSEAVVQTTPPVVRSVAVQMSVLLSFALEGCFNMGAGNCWVAALCWYSLMHTGEDWWGRRLPWTVVTSVVASWRGVRAGDSSVDPLFRPLGHVCQHLQIQPACWDQMLKSFRALCWAHSYGAWKHIGWECADASHCWKLEEHSGYSQPISWSQLAFHMAGICSQLIVSAH